MYYALDLGGTNFRISWLNSLQEIELANNIIKIKNTGSYETDSAQILKIMKAKEEKAEGIVVALPGNFNYEDMVIEQVNNLKSWIDKPFFRNLCTEFNCSVFVEKDVVVAGFGEGIHNQLQDKFLYITWGTGISGCLVTTNKNSYPKVKILNWRKIFMRIESLCSGGHATENFRCPLERLNENQWSKLINNFVEETIEICTKLKVEYIVLGGGIVEKKGDIFSLLQQRLGETGITMVQSPLGDFSGILGGYSLLQSVTNINLLIGKPYLLK